MASAPELILELIHNDDTARVAEMAEQVDPHRSKLSSNDLFDCALYLEQISSNDYETLEVAERWFLAAHSAGFGVRAQYRAALIRQRLKNWVSASELYFEIAKQPSLTTNQKIDVLGRLGWTLHFCNQINDSYDAYLSMLEAAPERHPSFLWTILSRSTNKFLQKTKIAQFLTNHSLEIDAEYERIESQQAATPYGNKAPVFIYWAQGIDQAPPIVKSSIAAWRRQVGNRLVFLDQHDVNYWVDIDSRITQSLPQHSAWFSDVLRIELLLQYGGIWVDATTFPSGNYADFEQESVGTKIFAPRYQGASISNWWLQASSQSCYLKLLAASLRTYWRLNDKPTGYFMFHHIFECLSFLYPQAEEEWAQAPMVLSRACHSVQSLMKENINSEQFHKALLAAPVQKLTHKLKDLKVTPETGLAHIVRWGYAEV